MQLKFRHKVFLTLLLNSFVIVISMLLIAGYFASRHFEDYINKVETARLNELVKVLSQEYQKNRSWAPVLGDLDHWLQLMGRGPGHPPGALGPGEPPLPPPFGKPPGPPPGASPGPPPGPRRVRRRAITPWGRASPCSMPKNAR